MTRPPPLELFTSNRPVRSDFARSEFAHLDGALERSYARRRTITVLILVSVICGIVYALWNSGPTNPADIPTIKAEGTYKQKPADPGGIDIPHQDVRVYDQLENKPEGGPQLEHLLPPPETPEQVPHKAPPAPVAQGALSVPAPSSAPAVPVKSAEILPVIPQKTVVTTVTPVQAPPPAQKVAVTQASPAPSAPPAENLSIEQVIANTKASVASSTSSSAPKVTSSPATAPVTTPPPSAKSSGNVAIQLASVSDQGKAEAMKSQLQAKYSAQLGGATLQLVRADLGSRGIFYRIQSQGLSEGDATRICSSLKKMNAGCILVRR